VYRRVSRGGAGGGRGPGGRKIGLQARIRRAEPSVDVQSRKTGASILIHIIEAFELPTRRDASQRSR